MTRRIADIVVPQPGWERIAGALKTHARDVLGVDVPTTGVPLYTDARHYAERGIPVVLYGAGPSTLLEANAHNADENLRLSDLHAATTIVAPALADLVSSSCVEQRRLTHTAPSVLTRRSARAPQAR